jgi:Tfp pilus assembly protein PilF
MMALRFAGALLLALGAALPMTGTAAPRVPADEGEVVETLPARIGGSTDLQRARREMAQRPRDEAAALEASRSLLEAARAEGDARYAGQALGALQAWEPMSAATPLPILVMHATVAQFLHDFDGAEATLKIAVAKDRTQAQAWLTLATVLRVRGRYAESDAACHAVGRAGQGFHAVACLAENRGLRGEHAAAKETLHALLAQPSVRGAAQGDTRQWLWTSIAEIEELAGRPEAAEQAYRQALAAERAGYPLLAYADFLIGRGRAREAQALLRDQPRSDAVLLRLAMAATGKQGRNAAPPAEAEELRSRFDAAALRPGTGAAHAREQSMFALDVQGDARAALQLARSNVALQREPIDLLLFARAAAAANDDAARREAAALVRHVGLRDARVDALLF